MRYEKSTDSRVLEMMLSELEVGQMLTYDDLSKAIRKDVRLAARAALQTARDALLRDRKMVFGVEQGKGVVRLNDEQIVESSEADRMRLNRAANRAIRKLEAVEFAKLSDEHKQKHIVYSAQMGAVSLFSGKKTTRRLETKVTNGQGINIGDTMQLFGGE